MTEKEIKPCPFCNSEASSKGIVKYSENHEAWWSDGTRVREAHYVNCIHCGTSNKGLLGHQTKEEAVSHWNRRDYTISSIKQAVESRITFYIELIEEESDEDQIMLWTAKVSAIKDILSKIENEIGDKV